MEYEEDFLLRETSKMLPLKLRQLWPFHLHCSFESRIILGESSEL